MFRLFLTQTIVELTHSRRFLEDMFRGEVICTLWTFTHQMGTNSINEGADEKKEAELFALRSILISKCLSHRD